MSRSNLEINGQCLEKRSAAAVTAAVYGIYAGFLGVEHGFFETLQGNTAPEHLKIYAVIPWELPFPFGHEPAMTVIPNFLFTGIAAMLCGLAIMLWSMRLLRGKRGAAVLLLLSVALLLVGGGFGPISLLIVACLAASQIGRTAKMAHRSKTPMLRRALARTWPWWLVASLLCKLPRDSWQRRQLITTAAANLIRTSILLLKLQILQCYSSFVTALRGRRPLQPRKVHPHNSHLANYP